MPLDNYSTLTFTPDEKRRIIVNRGLDPDQYTLDDTSFDVVPKAPSVQPNPANPPTNQIEAKPTRGMGETVGRNALLGLLPSAAGMASGALASEYVGLPLAPFTAGLSTIIAPIIGAIAGGYGMSKIQEKGLQQTQGGQEFLQNTAEANQQNPVSAVAGNIASTLPFMRVNPSLLKDAFKSITATGEGSGLSALSQIPGQVLRNPASANVALGAGVGVGQGLYDELSSDEPFNIPRFALNVGAGALLNDPRSHALNRAMGVHSYTPTETYLRDYEGGAANPIDQIKSRPTTDYYAGNPGDVSPNVNDIYAKSNESIAREIQKTKDYQRARTEEVLQNGLTPEDLQGGIAREEARPKPLVTTEDGKPIMPDYTGNTEHDNTVAMQESADELANSNIENSLSGEKQQRFQKDVPFSAEDWLAEREKLIQQEQSKVTKEDQDVRLAKIQVAREQLQRDRELLKNGQTPTGLLPAPKPTIPLGGESIADRAKRLSEQKGRKFVLDPNLKGIAGMYDQVTDTVTSKLSRPDNVPHELGHAELLEMPEGVQNRFYDNATKEPSAAKWIEETNKQKVARGEKPFTSREGGEEYLAQRIGEVDVKRIVNKDSNLRRDLLSWFKSNFSKKATTEDVARWLTNKISYGTKAKGTLEVSPKLSGTKNQEENTTQADINSNFPKMRIDDQIDMSKFTLDNLKALRDKHSRFLKAIEGRNNIETSNPADVQAATYHINEANKYNDEINSRLSYINKKQVEDQPSIDEGTSLYNANHTKLQDAVKAKDMDAIQTHWAENERIKSKYFGGHTPEGFEKSKGIKLQSEEQPSTTEEPKKPIPGVIEKEVTNKELLNATLPKDYKSNEEHLKSLETSALMDKARKHDEDTYEGLASKQAESKDKYWAMKKQLGGDASRNQQEDQPSTEPHAIDVTKQGFFRPFESSFDAVRHVSVPLSDAFKNWQSRKDQYIGMKNVTLRDLGKFDKDKVASVFADRRNAYRNETPYAPTGVDKEINDTLSSYFGPIRDKQIEAGLTINGREASRNENYVPDMLNDHTLDLFVNKGRTPQAITAKREWAQYIHDQSDGHISLKKASEDISDFIGALGGDRNNYKAINFGALRRASGYGLPENLRELDPVHALDKYGKRAASDLAMFQELESKPEIAASLKLPDPRTGVIPEGSPSSKDLHELKETKEAMKWVTRSFLGNQSSYSPKVMSGIRVINNALMGTATGLRDTASIPSFILPYMNKWSDLSAAMKGISNFRAELDNALKTAACQPSIDKQQFNDLLDAPDKFTAVAGKVATALRKWQGREAIENINRDVTFSIGKELARNNILGARAGDAQSQKFVEKFGRLVEGNPLELEGQKLDDALNQMAKNFTDRNQGTYGGSGLPSLTMEGPLAPYLSLQKWSIEKSNTIYQDVVKPFMTGENRLPLLTYSLASILTGAGIQELNKLLSGRKPQDADYHEALAVGGIQNITAELATLMQLGSFAGIVGDGAKFVSDIAVNGKTPRNIVSFPAATALSDLTEKTSELAEAIHQGENPWDVFKLYALDLMTHNVQAVRMAMNHTVSKDDVERSDRYRDLRVFNQLSGEPAGEPTKSNKYLNIDSQEFKHTDDLNKAALMLPKLLDKFQEKLAENPEKGLKFLQGLKSNSYQTMPNMESMPLEFSRYWQYLQKVQGTEKASQTLQNYIQQNAINHAKGSMVPG